MYKRFDDVGLEGTLHNKATTTLEQVYKKMEAVQKQDKLSEVTKEINRWIFKHIYPGMVKSKNAKLSKGGVFAQRLQQPADMILRQDRMPTTNESKASVTTATGVAALDGDELLPSTSCAFVTECAYAHILHLMAQALHGPFHTTIRSILTDRMQGRSYEAALPKPAVRLFSIEHYSLCLVVQYYCPWQVIVDTALNVTNRLCDYVHHCRRK